MKVPIIIWSRYRPAQLHLILESIFRHTTYLEPAVLVKVDDEYKRAYHKLFNRFDNVFIQEEGFSSFKENNVNLINNFRTLRPDLNWQYLGLTTDDTVFYRRSPQLDLSKNPQVFSLRYGLNTIVQDYHKGTYQPHLNQYSVYDSQISWNPQQYYPLNNYGYPFGLDATIYRSDLILPLMEKLDWKNTNQLETKLFDYRNLVMAIHSFSESVAVNIPINSVSNVTRAGENFGLTLEGLRDDYEKNLIIDVDSINSSSIVGCHQELPLRMKNYANSKGKTT